MRMKSIPLSEVLVVRQTAVEKASRRPVNEAKFRRLHVRTAKQAIPHQVLNWLKPTGPQPKSAMRLNFQRSHACGPVLQEPGKLP